MTKKKGYHINANRVSERVILCGRRKRALAIIRRLRGQVLSDDDYVIGTGIFNGKDLTVCSHGIGGPSIAIVVRELVSLGARRLVRVGSSGALHPSVHIGDIVIATGAVRDDGSEHIVPLVFPAMASPGVVDALIECSKGANLPPRCTIHIGLVHSKFDFYSEIPETTLNPEKTQKMWTHLRNLGVLCSEMECGTLFVISCLLSGQVGYEVETGAILVCAGDVEGEAYISSPVERRKIDKTMEMAIEIALRAISK